jgi:hypothetical protein
MARGRPASARDGGLRASAWPPDPAIGDGRLILVTGSEPMQ